ncbi:MAG: MFS transporter [Pseudomonadota bacterium]
MPASLYALMLGSFGIGMTEFVIMGLLIEIGADFHVSIAAAGMLISGYALGVVVGAPLVTMAVLRMPRKTVLLVLMAIFTLGNLACALAPDYWSLMAARVLTSLAHGAFFGIGSVVATGLVAKEKQASAIALMFTGMTLANLLGVPLGAWLGHAYGWRVTFWTVTAIGVVVLLAIAWLVPRSEGPAEVVNIKHELRVLLSPQVLLGLGITVLGFGGVFTVFTYISPLLTQLSGFSIAAVSPVLLVFGAGLVLGNTLGGKLADKSLQFALYGSLVVLIVVLILFGYTGQQKALTTVMVGLLGLAAFMTVAPMQMYVLDKASKAPNLASALNIAAFNLGNAGGAWLGGVVIDAGMGLGALHWVGALVTLSGLLLAIFSRWLEQRQSFVARQSCAG